MTPFHRLYKKFHYGIIKNVEHCKFGDVKDFDRAGASVGLHAGG